MTGSTRAREALVVISCMMSIHGLADDGLCPGYQQLVHTENVKECEYADSFDQCIGIYERMSALELLEPNEKFEFGYVQMRLGDLSDDDEVRLKWWARAGATFSELRRAYPEDINVIYYDSLHTDDDLMADAYREILRLAPGCSNAIFRMTWLRLGTREERVSLAEVGYQSALEIRWKVYFSGYLFRQFIWDRDFEAARRIQHRIYLDVNPPMAGDDDLASHRPELVKAVCSNEGFDLRLGWTCLTYVQTAIRIDSRAGRPLEDDVLRGVSMLSRHLVSQHDPGDRKVNYWEYFPHPAQRAGNAGAFMEDPLFPDESAQMVILLNDALDAVAPESESFDLYWMAEDIMPYTAKMSLLERLLRRDPENSEIRKELLRAAGKPIELDF